MNKELGQAARREYKKAELGTSLADINHRRRSGGQRFLLPTAVTRADLKPIVEEQGFYLLGKDIGAGLHAASSLEASLLAEET